MSDIINIDNRSPKSISKIFKVIEKYLVKLEASSNLPQAYFFTCTDASNKTEFENRSNRLEVGVKSNDRTVALVLLGFVRMIIDNHPLLLWIHMEDAIDYAIDYDICEDDACHISVKELVNEMVKFGECGFETFQLDDPLINHLRFYDESITIKRCVDDVDWWSLRRVMDEIVKIFK